MVTVVYGSTGAPTFSSPMVVLIGALFVLPFALIVSAEQQGHHYGNSGRTRSNVASILPNPRSNVHGLFLNIGRGDGTAPSPTWRSDNVPAQLVWAPAAPPALRVSHHHRSLGILFAFIDETGFSTGCNSEIICWKPSYFCFAQGCCLTSAEIGCGSACIPAGAECCNATGDWCDPGYILCIYRGHAIELSRPSQTPARPAIQEKFSGIPIYVMYVCFRSVCGQF
jgi:hypothetical protein